MQRPGSSAPADDSAHRLFFALWPDDAERRAVADAAAALRRDHAPRGRWSNPERYHLTLQFMGDFRPFPEDLVARAKEAAARLAVPPFTLQLDRAGSFRKRSIPWWLGCSAKPEGLQRLWDGLSARLVEAQVPFQSDRPLVPHVTILRDARPYLPDTPIPPVAWRIREVVLVDSVHGGQPEYRLLGRWPLEASHSLLELSADGTSCSGCG